MAHVPRETHDMCRQGVKPADRGRSVSPNAVERHDFFRLLPWYHCQKHKRHCSREDPAKVRFGRGCRIGRSTAAVHLVRNALRSETISVSLDVIDTPYK